MHSICTSLVEAESEPSLGGVTHRGDRPGLGLMLRPSDRGQVIFGACREAVLVGSFLPVVPIRSIVTGAEDPLLARNSAGSNRRTICSSL